MGFESYYVLPHGLYNVYLAAGNFVFPPWRGFSLFVVSKCFLCCVLPPFVSSFPSVQGLKVPEDDEEKDAVDLILGWKRKLDQHRYLETLYAPRTTRGLREVGKVKSDPSLADLVKSDLKFGRSP